jgi:hypothetical protein
MQITHSNLRSLLGLIATLALAACSDGGGISPNPITPSPDPLTFAVQGFWSGALDTSSSASAVIVDNGDAWVVFQQGATVTGFARAALQTTSAPYTGTGTRYNASGDNPQPFTMSTMALAGSGLQATFTTGTQPATGPVNMAFDRRYDTPASPGDVAGRWRTTFNGAASVLTLDIASEGGTMTGTSTTGCSYTGSLKPRPAGKAVFDLVLNETCLSSQVSLAGIGTLNEAKSSLALAYSTADRSRAGLLALQR